MGSGHSTSSRILVLGIDGAGKTSCLNKYENPGAADIEVQPSDGFVVKDVKVKGVKLNVWDVAGKEATRSLWKHYYAQGHTDAIIWVVDAADSEERLEESRNALTGALLDPNLHGTSFYFYRSFPSPRPWCSIPSRSPFPACAFTSCTLSPPHPLASRFIPTLPLFSLWLLHLYGVAQGQIAIFQNSTAPFPAFYPHHLRVINRKISPPQGETPIPHFGGS